MKNIPVISLALLIASLGFQTAFGKDAPASAEQLRSEIETAVKSQNTNTIVALVNWQGVATQMKSDAVGQIAEMVQPNIVGVKLLPLPADYQPTNEMDGVRYFPNVHVLGLINFESKEKRNDSQIPYGESPGGFYIAGVVQETFDPHATKSKSLGVAIMCFPDKEPEIINCSYKYVANGKEKADGFPCTNGLSRGFWGDYIKSCKVRRLSGSGSFQLLINENGKPVFDSDMVETNDVIVYEKK
jgi:hypothetical protein